MAKSKVDIDQLANAIMQEMNIFKDVTVEEITTAVKNTAKTVVKELKNARPAGAEKYGSWDEYRAGWKADRDAKGGRFRYDMVVHNATHYRLTHLLEKGHALVGGGRTGSFKHIEPIEQQAEDILMDELLHELERHL